MKTKNLILLCALMLIAMACTESSKLQPFAAEQKANAVAAINKDTTGLTPGDDVQTADAPTAVEGDDGPSEPVLLHLPDLNNLKGEGIDSLEIEIEDISDNKYEVSAALACNGLVNQNARIDFGKLDFSESIVQSVRIKASDLPIQQSQGAICCRVELTLNLDTREGLKSCKMSSTAFYVRHSRDYSKLRYFDEKTLIENFGGALSGAVDEERNLRAPGSITGRLKQGDVFTEISVMDERHAIRKDGKIVGWDLGTAIASERFEMKEGRDEIQE